MSRNQVRAAIVIVLAVAGTVLLATSGKSSLRAAIAVGVSGVAAVLVVVFFFQAVGESEDRERERERADGLPDREDDL